MPRVPGDSGGLAREAAVLTAVQETWPDISKTVPRIVAFEEGDRPALVETAIGGVRLLPNLDPLHAARDRELLVPDAAVRKRIWTVLGGPGTVLAGGDISALWRAGKKGKKLLVTVEPLGKLTRATKAELANEAERIAPFRGAETAELRMS